MAVRLYLSSFRLGDHPELLTTLAGSARAVAIANALDDAAAPVRDAGVQAELTALTGLDFEVTELDLRDYFGRQQALRRDLAEVSLVWVRGGNAFMLRCAMARSGADAVLRDMLADDALVYAGYSAGACVLSPSLRGLELVDDVYAVTRTYGVRPVWDGLGLLDEAFVPHYRSPDHPETTAIERVVAQYQADETPYRTLRDGQALLIDGATVKIV